MSTDKQLAKSTEHYQKALLINPFNDAIYHQLAELYYQQGDVEKTLETCQQALKVQADSILISETLFKVLTRLGFNEKEIECLLESFSKTLTIEEAFSALADVIKPLEELKSTVNVKTWKDALVLGSALAQQGNHDGALNLCFKAIKLEPSLNFPHFIIQYSILFKISNLGALVSQYTQAIQFPKIHRLAYLMLGDIFTKQDKPLDATWAYKSAWLKPNERIAVEKQSSQQRTSIDYLVIGIGKAGTSSLFHYLSQHPQIVNPHNKEIQFFNKYYEYGFDWYLAQFPPSSFRREKFLTGEATPWYLGTLGAEKQVFSAFPNIKLIVILRNPVNRAISHYYMSVKLSLEHRSLKEVITSEMAILENAENFAQISETYWKTERGYLWFSLCLPFLERWMSLFPKKQFLILNSKELYNAPDEDLKKIFQFLNIADFELTSYPKLNLGSYSQVDPELQKILFNFFYLHNQKLEEYLGMKFGWNNKL